jgi:hypothetical protein
MSSRGYNEDVDNGEWLMYMVDGMWPADWRGMNWQKTMEDLIKEGWPGFKIRQNEDGKFAGTHARKHEHDADETVYPWMEGRERKSIDRLTPDCETREGALALSYNVAVHAAMREIQRRNEEENYDVGWEWSKDCEAWVGFDRLSGDRSSGGPLLHALVWCIQQTAGTKKAVTTLDRVLG